MRFEWTVRTIGASAWSMNLCLGTESDNLEDNHINRLENIHLMLEHRSTRSKPMKPTASTALAPGPGKKIDLPKVSIYLPSQGDAGFALDALDALAEEGGVQKLKDLSSDALLEDASRPKKIFVWKERRLVLFDNYRSIPKISISLGPRDEGEAADTMTLDEPVSADGEMVDEVPGSLFGAGIGQTKQATVITSLGESETLEVAKAIVNSDGLRDVVLPSGLEVEDETKKKESIEDLIGIPKGAMVLIEGNVGPSTREVSQRLCQGILENGYTATYVTTQLNVGDFITEMYARDSNIADYLPEHKLLCIPVVPLIEKKEIREDPLDKLMQSPSLQTSDVVFVDTLSDFLKGDFNETLCMRILEYLRKLSGAGKTIFLNVDNGQKGMISLRLASDIQISMAFGEGARGVVVKKRNKARESSSNILLFKGDQDGITVHPREEERKPVDA